MGSADDDDLQSALAACELDPRSRWLQGNLRSSMLAREPTNDVLVLEGGAPAVCALFGEEHRRPDVHMYTLSKSAKLPEERGGDHRDVRRYGAEQDAPAPTEVPERPVTPEPAAPAPQPLPSVKPAKMSAKERTAAALAAMGIKP